MLYTGLQISDTTMIAFVERIRPAVASMDRILDVAGRIGPHRDCLNVAEAVKALQRLLSLLPAIRRIHPRHRPGIYDAATGFYIYQVESKQSNASTVIDGVVPAARSSSN
jgi:hypothetical protein